jgi:hypothetical protein
MPTENHPMSLNFYIIERGKQQQKNNKKTTKNNKIK